MHESPGGKIVKNFIKTQMNIIDSLPLPEPLKVPISLPFEILKGVNELAKKDESDQLAIDSAKTLFNAVQPRVAKSFPLDSKNIFESISKLPIPSDPQKLLEQVPSTASVILNISRKYGAATFKRAAERIESRMDKKGSASSISDLDLCKENKKINKLRMV